MARKSRKNIGTATHIETAAPQAVRKEAFNAGAYVRLSVLDRKQKGDSIETQQAIIGSYIAGHPDLELREIYIDNGLSGQSFERPAFQRMIADMESGKINCCVTKDLSRLGRNAIDTGYYIEKFFPMNGVRFIAITDNYDSADGQSGGIMVSLKNMVNEAYALEVGRKIRMTHQINIREGRFVGNMPPYGYLKSRDDCHVLVPDEYAAPIVRQMFEMTAEGKSIREILKWLTENEILTPSRYMHSKGLLVEKKISPHTHWSYQAVSEILRNRTLCGDMVQGKTKVVGQIAKKIPKSDWVIVEDTHTPIVSRELFEKVQEIRGSSSRPKVSKYGENTENIFTRRIFCAHCGFTMLRKRHSEKAYGFVCNTNRLYAKGACDGANISEGVLKNTIFDMLSKQEAKLSEILSAMPRDVQPGETAKDELASVQRELGKNKHYLIGLYESLMSGDITDTEYKDMKAAYEGKIAYLTEHEKQLREADQRRIRQENALTEAHGSVKTLARVSDLTTEVVGKLIEKIIIHADRSVTVKFTFMDEPVTSGGAEHE